MKNKNYVIMQFIILNILYNLLGDLSGDKLSHCFENNNKIA